MGTGLLTSATGTAALDPAMVSKYSSIPQPSDTVMAEYVWLDAVGNTRSKTRTLPPAKTALDKLPKWNFDGSSTDQAPFRIGAKNVLVMCEAVTPNGEPLESNSRAA